MITIVAGSREINNVEFIAKAISAAPWTITVCVCGMARGVDSIAAFLLDSIGVPVIEMPAKWDLHGKAAGPIRNREMAKIAEALVVIRYPDSHGSADMLNRMRNKNCRFIHDVVVPRIP